MVPIKGNEYGRPYKQWLGMMSSIILKPKRTWDEVKRIKQLVEITEKLKASKKEKPLNDSKAFCSDSRLFKF